MKDRATRHGGTWGRAVVVGGGYAGLVTARVLADHFSEVVILEQGAMDGTTGAHPHAPGTYHAHALLAKGAEVLETLFPGLRGELQDVGAPVFDYGEHVRFLLPTGFAPRRRTGVEIQAFTRDELERRLRGKVLALPGVTLLSSTWCDGPTMSTPGRVDGVVYRPDGLIAVGDAVCVFNPVYGQGLTVAALEADLLRGAPARRAARRAGLDGPGRAYQRAVARMLLGPWTLSSSSDLMWSPDRRPVTARIAHWYNKHVFELSVRDPRVWSRFVRVANMVAPPAVLFHPSVFARVIGRALFRRTRQAG